MRYWVYDDDGVLFRKFATREEAEAFLQTKHGWSLRVQPRQAKLPPTVETHGEARW